MRRLVEHSDLGNLQSFGAKDVDLRTIERSINTKHKVEMEEVRVPKPTTVIYIDEVKFITLEGY